MHIGDGVVVEIGDLNLVDKGQDLSLKVTTVWAALDDHRVLIFRWIALPGVALLALEVVVGLAKLSPLLREDVVDDAGLVEPDAAVGEVGALNEGLVWLVEFIAFAVTLKLLYAVSDVS